MAFISVTRLHLSSRFYFIPFAISTLKIIRQVKRSAGFRSGALGSDSQKGAWTVTVWDDLESMQKFRNSGAHLKAMRRLLDWCDEASFTHWQAEVSTVPSPDDAYKQMNNHGRLSKVRVPSPLHLRGETVSEGVPKFQMNLNAKNRTG